jgi:hypothetical protein
MRTWLKGPRAGATRRALLISASGVPATPAPLAVRSGCEEVGIT